MLTIEARARAALVAAALADFSDKLAGELRRHSERLGADQMTAADQLGEMLRQWPIPAELGEQMRGLAALHCEAGRLLERVARAQGDVAEAIRAADAARRAPSPTTSPISPADRSAQRGAGDLGTIDRLRSLGGGSDA